MLMHDPPHPGAFIRRQCLEPLGLTVTEAAKGLAVSRNTLSMLLNGRLGISPRWPSGSRRRSAALPRAGCSSSCSTTSGTHSTAARRFRSDASSPPERGAAARLGAAPARVSAATPRSSPGPSRNAGTGRTARSCASSRPRGPRLRRAIRPSRTRVAASARATRTASARPTPAPRYRALSVFPGPPSPAPGPPPADRRAMNRPAPATQHHEQPPAARRRGRRRRPLSGTPSHTLPR